MSDNNLQAQIKVIQQNMKDRLKNYKAEHGLGGVKKKEKEKS